MIEKDLPIILQMAVEEGWISDLAEFRIFTEFNPFGCFVCDKDNKIIGSIMTFSHNKSSWIGNFIVSKEYRGKGIGKKFLSKVIEYLDKKGKKQIYLIADYKAEKLYEKFGFRKVMPIDRWQGEAKKYSNNMKNIPETIPDITGFVELDASIWKDERFFLIAQFLFLRRSVSYFNPFGFLMYGNMGEVITIGPWELKDGNKSIAEKLFISALSNLKPKSKIFLDVPSINKNAEEILTKYNFKVIGSTMFMCRGKLPKIHFDEIFSFTTMGSIG